MEIRIDKSTLPQKERKLKFKTDQDAEEIGYYEPQDGIFTYGDGDFIAEWRVTTWEYMDGNTLREALEKFGKVGTCAKTTDGIFEIDIKSGFKNTVDNLYDLLYMVHEYIGDKFKTVSLVNLTSQSVHLILKP